MTRRLLMTADAVGGVWQYTLELAAALAPLGWSVDVALLGPAANEAQRAAAAQAGATLIDTGLPLDWLAADAAEIARTAHAVAALAAGRGATLVQLNQPALAAAPYAVPTVAVAHSCIATWWAAVEHGSLPDALAWQAAATREGLVAADAIVCPSAAFADALAAAYRLPRRAEVVHNGRTARASVAGEPHDFAFTAGRLWDRGKDAATLDRAAARLGVPFKAAGPVLGPNGERAAFAHLHALGPVDDATIAGMLSVRPVFVSAARYEPFGLAVLEAAQAGCALVLSDIPTFRELWDGAATFVAPGDDAGFTAAIEALICDPAERQRRGAHARLLAERYTPAATARAMADIYARLTAHDGRVAA